MNATVSRIVDLMFEDLAPNDEVCTLHDEIMANCQERYEDCMSRGLTEDEAIGAVVESLKGMDVILNAYPKKNEPTDSAPLTGMPDYTYKREGDDSQYTFSPMSIQMLDVSLTGHDVTIEPSDDGMIHVDVESDPHLQVLTQGSSLIVKPVQPAMPDLSDAAAGKKQLDFNSFGSMLSSLMKGVRQTMNTMSMCGDVTIRIPDSFAPAMKLATTSGNIELENVQARKLGCSSNSGDISLKLTQPVSSVKLSTVSGDIEAECCAETMNISTMSGDLTYRGSCSDISASTVSGDIELEGSFPHVNAKTVSGDLSTVFAEQCRARLNLSTTSGNMEVLLRGQSAHVNAKTVSGSVNTAGAEDRGELSDVQINANSVSGHIKVK